MEKIVESFELYGKQYRLETGELAKQASGAVLVTQGDTTCLVTAVVSKEQKDYDFFPLTVDFIEKMYSVGRIPGRFRGQHFVEVGDHTAPLAVGGLKAFQPGHGQPPVTGERNYQQRIGPLLVGLRLFDLFLPLLGIGGDHFGGHPRGRCRAEQPRTGGSVEGIATAGLGVINDTLAVAAGRIQPVNDPPAVVADLRSGHLPPSVEGILPQGLFLCLRQRNAEHHPGTRHHSCKSKFSHIVSINRFHFNLNF